MKRILFLAGLLIVGIITLGAFIMSARQHGPASVTLTDGTTVRVIGATYGTEKFSRSPALVMLFSPLSGDWQQKIWRWSNYGIVPAQINTAGPTDLSVWVDRRTNGISGAAPSSGGGYYSAFLADGSNFVSGDEGDVMYWQFQPDGIGVAHFRVFPHRSREITLHIFYHGPTGSVSECGNLKFLNPQYHDYPTWHPQSLPATNGGADVEATLLSLKTGFDSSESQGSGKDGTFITTHGTNRTDGRNFTYADLKLRPLKNTNEIWRVVSVELSDATGNSINNMSLSSSGNSASVTFMPSLWPLESPWKIKLTIKRIQGFGPEELFVFKDVPLGEVGETNKINFTTNVAGISLTLQQISRRAPVTNQAWSSSSVSQIKFTHSKLPPGTQLDLVGAVFVPGTTNQPESSQTSESERSYGFRKIPLDAKTANFIMAVHHNEIVEFTVNPELPRAEDISRQY